MGTTYNPPIVTDGLVFCLDAANVRSYPKSGTTWSDLIVPNNGTLINSVSFDASNGGSLEFDATNERVELGSISLDLYHISFWVYFSSEVTSASSSSSAIQYGSDTAQDVLGFGAVSAYATDETFTFISSDNYKRTYIRDTIPAGWSYVSSNWNGVTYDILLGAVSKTTYAAPNGHTPLESSTLLTVGSNAFLGKISNVSIYNRALTDDEIRRNYEATVGRFS